MKIVALDGRTLNPGDNPWTAMQSLGQLVVHPDTPTADQVIERAAGADVIITNKVPLNAKTIDALAPRGLRLIAVTATGYNIVDVEAAKRHKIPVVNVPVYGTDSVAQFTFALLLELCHHVGLHDRLVREGEWAKSGDFSFWRRPQIELAGLTMGIVGFGRIGQRVGEITKAFGMTVLPYRRGQDLHAFAAKSDVITLHTPQTPQTTGMINRDFLSHMKRSAFLINTARGALVVEQDLADALNRDVIAGAALDVVSAEPIKPDNPLLKAKNCILTPHMAWATLAARKRAMAMTVENVAAFIKGASINVVNA